MSPTDTLIRDLTRTRDEVLDHFSLRDADLARTYAPGKWSVRFILLHLADSELVLAERLHRVIGEQGVIWFYDQDKWAKALDYATRPLEPAKEAFAALRGLIISDARRHYEKDGALEFVHSTTGLRTLKEEFDKVASHTEHHLAQIRVALRASA
jgi:hypothetical protein